MVGEKDLCENMTGSAKCSADRVVFRGSGRDENLSISTDPPCSVSRSGKGEVFFFAFYIPAPVEGAV